MKLPTLYSRATTGALRQWTIEVQGSSYRTHSGAVGGKIVISGWYAAEATNTGRANARNTEEQAVFEAQAKWQKKVEAGYTQSVDDVDTSVTFFEPMLAKKWEDRKSKVSFPLYSQPKLDGLRAAVNSDGATSRNGKPWVTIPHILEALAPLFAAHPEVTLDGELYNHEYKHDFNTICSLVKRTKPTQKDYADSKEKVQYWVYDIQTDDESLTFSERSQLLSRLLKEYVSDDCIVNVVTSVAATENELDLLYSDYMQVGYEGQMVRLDAPYENKRSANLLKRKEFQDDEYRIIDICEGNGNKSGMAGYAILRHPDGRTFNSNIKGQHDFLTDLLKNRETYLGTYATCTFFNLTPDGIPRFPYVTRLREGKSID
jgi:DNA ligase 1